MENSFKTYPARRIEAFLYLVVFGAGPTALAAAAFWKSRPESARDYVAAVLLTVLCVPGWMLATRLARWVGTSVTVKQEGLETTEWHGGKTVFPLSQEVSVERSEQVRIGRLSFSVRLPGGIWLLNVGENKTHINLTGSSDSIAESREMVALAKRLAATARQDTN